MSPAERLFRDRLQRRANTLAPDLRAAILRAFAQLRDTLSASQLEQFIRSQQAERIFTELLTEAEIDKAFAKTRVVLRDGVERAGELIAKELPGAAKGIAMDALSPNVIQAVRDLNTKVMGVLSDDIREVVRAYLEQGLREGLAPRTIARQLRSVIGLSPSQLEQVQNFRASLRGGAEFQAALAKRAAGVELSAVEKALLGRSPFDYLLRDKRFDATLKRLLGPDGKGLSPEQIESMTEAYLKRRIAQNADVIVTTASLDTQRLAQHLSFSEAIRRGDLDGAKQFKRWSQVDRPTKRETHAEMHGEVVRWDELYSNGDMIPGDSDPWNCACLSIYFTSHDPANARRAGTGLEEEAA